LENKIVLMENILSPAFVRSCAEEFEVNYNVNTNPNHNEKAAIEREQSQVCLSSAECEQARPQVNDNISLTANRSPQNPKLKYINLLSIGRYCYQKNLENVPDICSRIISKLATDSTPPAPEHPKGAQELSTLNSKLSIKWYIMGYGGDEQLIRDKIAEAGMEDHVIILGKRTNPYPYIKACDIYVQPSRYEGKSVTVREAQMLCKPVVVTNYPTASSQIKDGIDGKIVPMDNEGCAQGLAEFIVNTELQDKIKEYLSTHDYGNMAEVEKIYDLL